MGSDADLKISSQSRWRKTCARRIRRAVPLVAVASFFLWAVLTTIRSPVQSFRTTDGISYPLSTVQRERCDRVASRFHQCQEHPRDGASLVLGCHRKWCDSSLLGGSCTPCSGIGTRLRCMMTLAAMAHSRCIRVEFDAPERALLIAEDAAYRDSLLAELLHFRSYGDRLLRSKAEWSGGTEAWEGKDRRTYLHGTPEKFVGHWVKGVGQAYEYDPCLFHSVFRPSAVLQADIDAHLAAIGHGAIGIHFRVGDEAAYGIGNKDVRISGPLEESFHKMMDCARRHAGDLLPGQDDVVFLLATDSFEVKRLASRDPTIYMTNGGKPQTWLRVDSDYEAWLEIFLLSRMKGLVANKRVKDSHGTGNPVSTFVRLAAKVGFMTDDQFLACELD